MATKKPSSKKSTKKSSSTSTKSTRKAKNQAPEIIDAKENQTIQPTDVLVADDTQATISQNSVVATETNAAANITQEVPTVDVSAPISVQEKNIHKDEVIVENASYNNMVVPHEQDNTYAFIIGGIVAILTIILFFL